MRRLSENKPIPDKVYYSITEVADITGLKPHILRYWETEFPVLKPRKNRAGNRAYRKKDIEIILLIKKLLYEEGFTIDGAKRRIRELRKVTQMQSPPKDLQGELRKMREFLRDVKEELETVIRILAMKDEAGKNGK